MKSSNKKILESKSSKLFSAIGEIDERLIDLYNPGKKGRFKRLIAIPIAACICLLAIFTMLPPLIVGAEFTVEDGVLISYNGKKQDVKIPKNVTSIADYAFSGTPQISTVTLSENISSIGSCAFAGCKNLSDIIISEDNKNFTKENGVVFSSDHKLIVKYFGTDDTYEIPEGVLFLAGEAFSGSNLTQIILNSSIRFIGKDCFSGIEHPPVKQTDEFGTYLKDNFGNSLYLLRTTDYGELFGHRNDGISVFENTVTSYSWNEENSTVYIYRFGCKGEYYKLLSFNPDTTGIANGVGLSGNFRSKNDGMLAIDSGVTIKYDENGNEYIVNDDPYYDGFALVTDIYITRDGGMSWSKLPSRPPLRNQKYCTESAGFADDNVGYICSRIYGNTDPIAWVTTDGGCSWEEMHVKLPEHIEGSSQIFSIERRDNMYILTVEIHNHTGYTTIYYRSHNGIDWTYTE